MTKAGLNMQWGFIAKNLANEKLRLGLKEAGAQCG